MSKVHARLQPSPAEAALDLALSIPDEVGLDGTWAATWARVKEVLLRPAKRVRPALVEAGYALATGQSATPAVHRFGAGLELLHGFMLVHDDVADRAPTRRGGPALHHLLAPDGTAEAQRLGENLAVVAGDHLYARALEQVLGCGAPHALEAGLYLLGICRHTAVGQTLDLKLSQAPLAQVTLFETVRVAHLKTARYGFVAPLVCGAMLGGADEALLETLSRVGRHVGLAFQLRDDLLGLFGDDRLAGKDGGGDFFEGKRTFPVIAAWTRADAAGRAELERLWAQPTKDAAALSDAREAVRRFGGLGATTRMVQRATRAAEKALAALPPSAPRALLSQMFSRLSTRSA